MKSLLQISVLGIICCVVLQEAKAQEMYGKAEVSYHAATNSMYAYAELTPDYSALATYCPTVNAYIFKDGAYQTIIADDPNFGDDGWAWCGGTAQADTFLPYEPNADYMIEAYEGVRVHSYRDESGMEEFYDWYNYTHYSIGEEVYEESENAPPACGGDESVIAPGFPKGVQRPLWSRAG